MDNINGIILLGPPGSGKSTIGKVMAKRMGMVYISSGDVARKLAKIDRETWDSLNIGKMANEELMRDTIYKMLYTINVHGNEFILDGFPRFEDQWIWLKDRFPVLRPIYINTPISKCISRMKERHRDDDVSDIMACRMDYYREFTQPMINNHSLELIAVNNISSIDITVTNIMEGLKYESL